MKRKESIKYALCDYSRYNPLDSKGWSKRARKVRTMIRKNYGNTKCDTFGEKVSRKRTRMKLISIYRRMPSFSLKSLANFKVVKGKKVKSKLKTIG